jgi:hypothetical protein
MTDFYRLARLVPVLLIAALSAVVVADEVDDHPGLRDLQAAWLLAQTTNDFDAIAPYLHPGFTGVMLSNQPIDSPDALPGHFQQLANILGHGGRYEMRIVPERVEVRDGFALIGATTQNRLVTAERKTYAFYGQWTALAVPGDEPDQWLLLRLHASIDPFDNPFLEGVYRPIALAAGFIGAVIGLLLGIAATVYAKHRPAAPASD